MRKLLVGLTFLFMTSPVFAEPLCSEATALFKSAVQKYKASNANDFVKQLLKNGPLEADQRSLSQGQNLLQIEQFFGSVEGASILSTKPLGARACYLIGIMEYQRGPAFAVLTYYSGSKGLGITSMFFQTEPEQILPKEFLVP